jgi:hypothetical protein
MTEPDVTLTDYGLAIECIVFTYLLYYHKGDRQQPLRIWSSLFFGSLGMAAFTGGTVHGFFLDTRTTGHAILWPLTLLAIGATALAAWSIGAWLLFSKAVAHWISTLATVGFIGYSVIVLSVTQAFWIAVINYLPAAFFLLIAFSLMYKRFRAKPLLIGLMGLVLTFVAAGVQQGKVVLHPVYFNHNALYHLIQAVALFMIFWSTRWFLTSNPTPEVKHADST